MLGAFLIHGLKPGPLLFMQQPVLVYSIFVGMLLANLSIIILAKLFIRYFSKVIELPYNILGPGIIIFCVVGSFAIRNNFGDIWIMILFAIIGFFMERYGYPLAPIILGIVLGIIHSFDLLGSTGIDHPQAVSAGIAQALVTTATGLAIAIFTLIPFNYFQSRVEQAVKLLEKYGTSLEILWNKQNSAVASKPKTEQKLA